ncbi:thiamine pyrophosphate-dependent enzyme [Candidatus Entotheonella palauensis]|uniref:Pyruvate synthase n=1 Tax=Candidatus Entotheonella gemina TaxID=1429439 RepID=W4M456_9BACT|nr:thiamine pyrophosphate-dependent enzyme [Candidatus Entotheonella palauensis]ETX04731.1 MAG: pyruvate synthase [Candidatus Entotheonella gemina]
MSIPMSSELEAIKNLKQISREEFLLPGTSVCGGCGGLEALRLAAKVLGPKTVFVNAAGCFTLLAVFPYTPLKGSWLYTTMASAAAGAQGVRDALDVLMERGKMKAEDDVDVVVVAGDGSTYDMAFSSISGAIFRQLDFWYFCYDNESYGNTGMQMSSATPYGARTATTPVSARTQEGTEHGKKDLFEIWRAHHPAYLATVSPRYPVDLTNKFLKAKSLRGPKLFIAHAPCPTGWLYGPEHTAEYARLAVDTGLFALKETVDGTVTHTHVPRRRRPVADYLQGQGRYRHLFEPERNETAIRQIQAQVDRYWETV